MKKVSLVMIVKDEAEVLARCLDSARHIVDEIIIADTGSSDRTKDIALDYGAKVVDYIWEDDFSKARNFALSHSSGDWNLILDADEDIVQGTKADIHNFVENNTAIGRIRVVSKIRQDNAIRYSGTFIPRLIPKGIYFQGRIHEQIDASLPRRNTPVVVNHDGYYEKDKTGRNLRLLLMELEQNPEDPYFLYQVGKQYKLMRDFRTADAYFESCYKYLSRNAAYRDMVVTDYLYNMIAYQNLTKGLEIIEKEKVYFTDYADFHFVCALFYMELIFFDVSQYSHLLPEIEREYKTCLQLGETNKYSTTIGTGSFLAAYNLGVYYETTGDKSMAKIYYTKAAAEGYEPALARMSGLSHS